MKNKRAAIYAMVGVAIVLLLFIGINVVKNIIKDKEEKELEESQPVLIEEETETYAEEETEGDRKYAETEKETELEDFPCRVMIENLSELSDENLGYAGIDLLEPYLSQYFDYYLQDGNNYIGQYVSDSYEDDYNYPTFEVYVPDLDLTIECGFIVSQDLYRFTSRFNPDGE